jgi:hypothetical protein
VTEAWQQLEQPGLELEAGVVAAEVDPHAAILTVADPCTARLARSRQPAEAAAQAGHDGPTRGTMVP